MGDGKRLKEILDEKGFNVVKISKLTGINASTLYAIIQRDSNIRFDYALRIANELDIDYHEICSANAFSGEITEEEIYPTIKDATGILDSSRIRTYVKFSLLPLLKLYGKNGIVDVDKFLTDFYTLDDESRQELIAIMNLKLQSHKDPKREEEIKQIKYKGLF